jgi:hypothetical protein
MISTITTDQKSTALESVNLICVNTHSNANKFWSAWVLPSGDLYVEYGRQGYSPKPHFYNSPSIDASRNKLRSLTTLEDCLNQIDEIRSLIQSELAGVRAEQDDRAFWVNWGASEEVTPSEMGSSDLRSLGVVWDG